MHTYTKSKVIHNNNIRFILENRIAPVARIRNRIGFFSHMIIPSLLQLLGLRKVHPGEPS